MCCIDVAPDVYRLVWRSTQDGIKCGHVFEQHDAFHVRYYTPEIVDGQPKDMQNLDLVQSLVELGRLVQITANSITGFWGESARDSCLKLITTFTSPSKAEETVELAICATHRAFSR
jgi:hypothetical protein